jgi:hypothetical protein
MITALGTESMIVIIDIIKRQYIQMLSNVMKIAQSPRNVCDFKNFQTKIIIIILMKIQFHFHDSVCVSSREKNYQTACFLLIKMPLHVALLK